MLSPPLMRYYDDAIAIMRFRHSDTLPVRYAAPAVDDVAATPCYALLFIDVATPRHAAAMLSADAAADATRQSYIATLATLLICYAMMP